MIATVIVAGALMLCPAMDKWELKPGIAPKAKAAWVVGVDAFVEQEEHHAEFTLIREIGDADGEHHKATYTWARLTVDDQETGEEPAWSVTVGARGAVVSTTDMMGDDIRRMLSPMAFVYPDKPVGEGDTWSAEVRPYKDKDDYLITYTYEVKGVEKIDDADTLKIAGTLSEKANQGLSAEGTWWVGKDGSVLKFDVKVKNWVVPMAGADIFEARIYGKKG